MKRIVAVFGSGEVPKGSRGWREAHQVGRLLARSGCIVMNGGYGGAMAACAQGAKRSGGQTIGITTRDFGPGRANPWIDREKRMPRWQDRLIYLVKNSDACVALPGRLGTLIEIAVTLEMMRKGLIPLKPVIILGEAWKKLFAPYLAKEGNKLRTCFYFARDPNRAIKILASYL